MSKAPEWIYLDGDVEAGDGMFPRCFEDPKYASEPPIEYGRIDLLEAAEQRAYANAMEAERKLHEARIEELYKRLKELIADKIELKSANIVLMRKLAKAVEALERIAGKVPYADDPWDIASLSLAELKGETDE